MVHGLGQSPVTEVTYLKLNQPPLWLQMCGAGHNQYACTTILQKLCLVEMTVSVC